LGDFLEGFAGGDAVLARTGGGGTGRGGLGGGGAGGGGGGTRAGQSGDLGCEAGDLGVPLGGAGFEAVVLAGEGGVAAESDSEFVFGGL
jgi:hypothetical protein